MHEGDLGGRAAEGEQPDARPDAERLAKAGARRPPAPPPRSFRGQALSSLPTGVLAPASCGSRPARRGTSDRAHRRAPCWPRAGPDRPCTCASSPARQPAAPPIPAPDRGAPYRRRARCSASWSNGGEIEAELLHHGVEGASLAAMAPEHVLDVEGRGGEALGHRRHFRRGHEKEDGLGIDEAADQPGAGDAVDLGPRAGDPARAARLHRAAAACSVWSSDLAWRRARRACRLPGISASMPS